MIADALYSSSSDEWSTPQNLYDLLNAEFHFTLDVCATIDNTKCENYFSPLQDGLKQEWSGVCFMNPPYSNVKDWMQKAYEESLKRGGPTVVCLVPARTDTRWFHSYVYWKAEVRFIKGRLKFSNSKNSAPFPSMIVVYRGS